MSIIQVLLQKEALVFRNSYFRTRKRVFTAFGLLILSLVFMGGQTWIFTWMIQSIHQSLADIPPELGMPVIIPLFYLFYPLMLTLLFSTFTVMLQEARVRFYDSPELILLISTPIPTSILFIFRFIMVTCLSKWALMNLPFGILPLIAIGIFSAAPWYYYLFILPVAYLLLTIAASLAVTMVMLLVKVISSKRIMQAGAFFGFLSSIVWVGFFIFFFGEPQEILLQLLEWIRAAGPVWAILLPLTFPLTDAATTLTRLVEGELVTALGPLLRLFLTSGVVLAASMQAAKRLYYSGYDKTQTVEASTKKPIARPAREPLSLGRKWNLILTEWKKAGRNYEMASGSIVLLMMLIVYLFMAGLGWLPIPEPWHRLVSFVHIGVIGFLTSAVVAIFFIPTAALKEGGNLKNLIREQYGLLKAAPFGGREFTWCLWLAPFVPQLLFGGIVLLALNISIGSSILTTLLSLVVLSLLVGSVGALSLALEMEDYTVRSESFSLARRFLRSILPFVYYIVALGILALGQVYAELGFLRFLHYLPQGLVTTISGAVFLTLTSFAFYYSFRLGAKSWEEMEIL